jgi:hypothetical protein
MGLTVMVAGGALVGIMVVSSCSCSCSAGGAMAIEAPAAGACPLHPAGPRGRLAAMPNRDRVLLLFGPYKPPPLKRGDQAHCLFRDCEVVITSWADATIPWPRCRAVGGPGGGSGCWSMRSWRGQCATSPRPR